jgi:hypothetical protein
MPLSTLDASPSVLPALQLMFDWNLNQQKLKSAPNGLAIMVVIELFLTLCTSFEKFRINN